MAAMQKTLMTYDVELLEEIVNKVAPDIGARVNFRENSHAIRRSLIREVEEDSSGQGQALLSFLCNIGVVASPAGQSMIDELSGVQPSSEFELSSMSDLHLRAIRLFDEDAELFRRVLMSCQMVKKRSNMFTCRFKIDDLSIERQVLSGSKLIPLKEKFAKIVRHGPHNRSMFIDALSVPSSEGQHLRIFIAAETYPEQWLQFTGPNSIASTALTGIEIAEIDIDAATGVIEVSACGGPNLRKKLLDATAEHGVISMLCPVKTLRWNVDLQKLRSHPEIALPAKSRVRGVTLMSFEKKDHRGPVTAWPCGSGLNIAGGRDLRTSTSSFDDACRDALSDEKMELSRARLSFELRGLRTATGSEVVVDLSHNGTYAMNAVKKADATEVADVLCSAGIFRHETERQGDFKWSTPRSRSSRRSSVSAKSPSRKPAIQRRRLAS